MQKCRSGDEVFAILSSGHLLCSDLPWSVEVAVLLSSETDEVAGAVEDLVNDLAKARL